MNVDGNARSLRRIDRTLRSVAIGAAILLTVWALSDILLLVFAAILLACILRGAAELVERLTGLGAGWSLLLVVTVFVGAVAFLIWWDGQQIATEMAQVGQQLGEQLQNLWQRLQQAPWAQPVTQQIGDSLSSSHMKLVGFVTGWASSTLSIASSMLIIVVTGLFLAISPDLYRRGSLQLLPPSWRPRGAETLMAVGRTLQLWFLGQLIDMTVIAFLSWLGLFLLGEPLALTLALIAGVLNFVPYVGAIAGAVPAVLVAFAHSPTLAMWVAVLFIGIQFLEGNVIAPLVQKRTVSLPPALTILSQTILGTLFGLFGIILATPAMAAVMVTVRMLYVETLLEGKGASSDQREPCTARSSRDDADAGGVPQE
ncbi:MAG: AI-2E family transporter [Acetobacteraceae bacterium]